MNIIQVKKCDKSFGDIQALNQLDFFVKQGEIFGLLGPNGAGKSTTINLLSGLLQPDRGAILIDDIDMSKNTHLAKKRIGIVPQEIALYDELSAYENLIFWGKLYNIPTKELKKRVNDTLNRIGLSDRKSDAVGHFSGGMKRRVNIGAALLHQPKILLMDEPTVGIDPQSRNHIFDLIEELNREGMSIIYATHYMEEAERLCHTIGIMDQGRIIAKGNLQALKDKAICAKIVMVTLKTLSRNMLDRIKDELVVQSIDDENQSLSIPYNHLNTDMQNIIQIIQNAGGEIQKIETQSANLEDVFLQLTGKKLRD